MGFFSNEEFIRYKKCTQPVYQTPASIQQMLDIAGVHENGIFEIEPNNGAGKKRRKDLVYAGRCRRFHAVHFHGLYGV